MANAQSFPATGERVAPFSHPGALLRNVVLPAMPLTLEQVAESLGVAPEQLADVVAERAAVDAALALRLGKYFGNGAAFWLTMQANYDLGQVEPTIRPALDRIPVYSDAAA